MGQAFRHLGSETHPAYYRCFVLRRVHYLRYFYHDEDAHRRSSVPGYGRWWSLPTRQHYHCGYVQSKVSFLLFITLHLFTIKYRERSFYMGFIGLIWAIAGAIGPILGGVFTQYLSWRGIFWMNAPICGTAFLLLLLFLDVHNPRTPLTVGIKAVDWFGTISILGLMTMLLLGLDFGGATFPWKSPTVIGLIVAGSCMGGFFFWSERSLAKYPLMPLDIFKEKSNIASLLVAFFHDYVRILYLHFPLPESH